MDLPEYVFVKASYEVFHDKSSKFSSPLYPIVCPVTSLTFSIFSDWLKFWNSDEAFLREKLSADSSI